MSGVCLVSTIGNSDYILGGSPLSRLSVQSKSVCLSFSSFCQQNSWNTTHRNTAAIFTVVTTVNGHTSRHLGYLQQAHVADTGSYGVSILLASMYSGKCDYYTFHVIASNPAGNSTPANLTRPVTFAPPGLENVRNSVFISIDNTTMIRFVPLDGYEYFIANANECLNVTRNTTDELTVFEIPYPHNCTVLTEHNCTSKPIPINISNVIATSISPSATPPNNGPTGTQVVWVIIAIVAVILVTIAAVAVITIIILFVSVRQRKRNDSLVKPDGSVSTVDTDIKDEKVPQFKDDKPIPLQNKQPMPEYMTPADALKQNGNSSTLKALQEQTPGLVSSSGPEYATPSVPHHNTQKVQDMPLYSDVFETQKAQQGTTWRSSQRKSITHPNKSPAGSSLPPPPSFGTTDEYSNLQHALGGSNQPLDQHVYDSAQTDQPQYSSITQPKKTKYTDVHFSPDAGLTIQGNTSTVQYSVVGDTPNMEYSAVGPKTNISQDCPPPPSADVVRDMMNH